MINFVCRKKEIIKNALKCIDNKAEEIFEVVLKINENNFPLYMTDVDLLKLNDAIEYGRIISITYEEHELRFSSTKISYILIKKSEG